jgi:hypothetical protein
MQNLLLTFARSVISTNCRQAICGRFQLDQVDNDGSADRQSWQGQQYCVRSEPSLLSNQLERGFGLSGDVPTSQTWPDRRTRLSSCHGD